jgi:hypothetical protein
MLPLNYILPLNYVVQPLSSIHFANDQLQFPMAIAVADCALAT